MPEKCNGHGAFSLMVRKRGNPRMHLTANLQSRHFVRLTDRFWQIPATRHTRLDCCVLLDSAQAILDQYPRFRGETNILRATCRIDFVLSAILSCTILRTTDAVFPFDWELLQSDSR